MKKLSTSLLATLVATKRKELKLTQQDLADATGINRAQISRLEKEDYLPSIPQLEQLGETLGFEPDEVFVATAATSSITITAEYRSSRNRICWTLYCHSACTAQSCHCSGHRS